MTFILHVIPNFNRLYKTFRKIKIQQIYNSTKLPVVVLIQIILKQLCKYLNMFTVSFHSIY